MNRPAAVEIVYERMRFLITHNPTNATLNKFTEVCLRLCYCCLSDSQGSVSNAPFHVFCQELKKFEVNTLVRVCDATYDKAPVEKEGIQVLVSVDIHFCGSLLLDVCAVQLSYLMTIDVFCFRTGLLMMVPLLPPRSWITGSSCSTPNFESNPAAALPYTVWQASDGMYGVQLASFSPKPFFLTCPNNSSACNKWEM